LARLRSRFKKLPRARLFSAQFRRHAHGIDCRVNESSGHVWAERYDRPVQDIFAVQDEIADTIAARMQPEIGAVERERARRKPPEHLGAWEHHQRGMWHLLQRNRADLVAAQAFFRRAIEVDPSFATPRAALALSCFFQITHGFATDHSRSLEELFAEASQAVALDPKDALAHTAATPKAA